MANKLEEKRIKFETAKLLKKLGFRFITGAYWQDGVEIMFHPKSNTDNNEFPTTYEAPTQSGLAQWLRDEYEIHAFPSCNGSGWFWEMEITNGTGIKWNDYEMFHEEVSGESYNPASGQWDKYEDAFEDVLMEALTMIKGGYKA
jgi:hypothetical protein